MRASLDGLIVVLERDDCAPSDAGRAFVRTPYHISVPACPRCAFIRAGLRGGCFTSPSCIGKHGPFKEVVVL